MEKLIRYFLKYPFNANMLMFVIFIGGVISVMKMKSTFFPENPSKTISIQATYPGASPEEIEEGIVRKIEDKLRGLAGIDQIVSQCSENAGSITVTVLDETETDLRLQDVKNAVNGISSFPVGMEPALIYKQDARNFAISFAVSGNLSLKELKGVARQIEDDLRSVEGISQISLSGFPNEEIEIILKEEFLSSYNITFNEIALAIAQTNLESTGGKVKTQEEELIIRGRFKQYNAKDLLNIVVRADAEGRIIRLSDVATVSEKWDDDNPNRNWFNGKPAVIVTINNLNSEDLLFITDETKAYIAEFNQKSQDCTIDIVRDQSISLNQRIDLLATNGYQGFICVVILLALFLNLRIAYWVALAIPVAFAGMFLLAPLFGVTINIVSLFGMIVVIGILVDDGIVIAENIYQHHEAGESRVQATINGTMEVLPAVFSAIITTVVAFSMFFFIEGRLGDIFAEMAIVVILTLVFSLVEGAIILPAHIGHSKAISKGKKLSRLETFMKAFMKKISEKFYGPVLRFAMKYSFITYCMVIAVLIISTMGLLGSGLVKFTFFPNIEADNININLKMDPGTRSASTMEILDQIEQAALKYNELEKERREDGESVILGIDKRIGPTTYQGSINLTLLDADTRGEAVQSVTNKIREQVGPVYGVDNLTFGGGSFFGKPVSLSLLGNDIEQLQSATEEVKKELLKREDLKDVEDNNQAGLKEINIKLKPKARLLGLNEQQILTQLRQGFFGYEAQRLQRGRDEVRVWIRLSEKDRSSINELEKTRIRTNTGLEVPLSEVCDYTIERGVTSINRLYGKREIQISSELSGPKVSANAAMADIKSNVVPDILAKYPEVEVSYEGQSREQTKSAESLASIIWIIFGLMFLIIALTFRSVYQAAAVFFLIPFGFVGVTIGHFVMGEQLSFPSILGVIALVGILVNDALVFVAAFNSNIKRGMEFKEALYESGLSRFRPIVLTSLTTIAGLGPLLVANDLQAKFLVPMAIAVAFGLLFVTVLILILLPIHLIAIANLKRFVMFAIDGDWRRRRTLENAYREQKGIEKLEEEEE